MLLTGITNGGWKNLPTPVGFLTTPPFNIQQKGVRYRVDPSFNLENYANIAVTKTYYLDSVNGSDSNTGLSWGQAWRTLTRVNTAGDCDLLYIAANSYFQKNQRPASFTRNMKIIGLGSGASRPRITADVNNQTGAFSVHSGNCYRATIAEFVGYAYDNANVNSFGNPTALTDAGSIAACISTPGTFFTDWPNRFVYVNLFNGRVPDSSLILGDANCMTVTANNRTQYFENIVFGSGVALNNSSSVGGLRMYFKNCRFNSLTGFGVTELITQSCEGIRINNAGDVMNYDTLNTIATTAFEIDCTFTNQRLGDSTNQASTTHNGCRIVRVGGLYHNTAGQNVADVTSGQTWMLGSELRDSVSGVGGYFSLGQVWLDGVYIPNNNVGINIDGTCQGRYRNLRNFATTPTLIAGTASWSAY